MVQTVIKASEVERVAADAINLGHLAHMTLGDRDLQREILQLFDRQADLLLDCIRRGDAALPAALARTLNGSARRIGAWGVARAADASERAAAGSPVERRLAMDDLSAAVAEARMAIAELLKAE